MTTTKIQDFGEKIGGAKKDFFSNVKDIDFNSLNAAALKNVKKKSVWSEPNFKDLISNGTSRKVAMYIKLVRDAAPASPGYKNYMSIETLRTTGKNYVEFISDIRDSAMALKTEDDIKNFYDSTIKKYLDFPFGRPTLNSLSHGFLNNKLFHIAMYYDRINLEAEIIKNRFCLTPEETEFYGDKPSTNRKNRKPAKQRFNPVLSGELVRTGEDYRHGRNVTGDDFMKVFGFRGGEFGNWVNEKERQASMNYAFDALIDLAKTLDIATTDISLGGKLAIAFGSRGRGSAAAHYEPDREVINLTKIRGAGSLSHEWAHALDDIVGKKLGIERFMTEVPNSSALPEPMKQILLDMQYRHATDEEIQENINKSTSLLKNCLYRYFGSLLTLSYRKEINTIVDKMVDTIVEARRSGDSRPVSELSDQAINDIKTLSDRIGKPADSAVIQSFSTTARRISSVVNNRSGLVKSDYEKNSEAFGKTYAKSDNGYWESNIEMFARAFATYSLDKLGPNRCDYLNGHAECAYTIQNDGTKVCAYPIGEERKKLNQDFDSLISWLKEKEILHKYEPYTETVQEEKQVNIPSFGSAGKDVVYQEVTRGSIVQFALF